MTLCCHLRAKVVKSPVVSVCYEGLILPSPLFPKRLSSNVCVPLAVGLRHKLLSLDIKRILSSPRHVCCTYFRHMPPLGIMTRFDQNKCRSHHLGRRSQEEGGGSCECRGCCEDGAEIQFHLGLCKDWPHFWVMFWYSLSRCLLGFKMSHAWRARRARCVSSSSAVFFLNV